MAKNIELHRRSLLHGAAALAFAGISPSQSRHARGQESYQKLNRFPRMVHEFFVDQVRAAEERSLAKKARLASRSDAERYIASVQEKIQQCFGPHPARTPLNARVTRTIDRGRIALRT